MSVFVERMNVTLALEDLGFRRGRDLGRGAVLWAGRGREGAEVQRRASWRPGQGVRGTDFCGEGRALAGRLSPGCAADPGCRLDPVAEVLRAASEPR